MNYKYEYLVNTALGLKPEITPEMVYCYNAGSQNLHLRSLYFFQFFYFAK